MSEERENIFSVPHSLPSSAHPIALATRTPAGLVKAESTKFMPDYGGTLEIPGTSTKQYCLRRGIPFDPDPSYAVVLNRHFRQKSTPETQPHLIVTTYLDQDVSSSQPIISAFKAIGSTLYFDAFHSILGGDRQRIDSNTYTHFPYPFAISGLKYHDVREKFLIVKSQIGCKLMRLDPYYDIPDNYTSPCTSDTEEDDPKTRRYTSQKSVCNFEAGFPERRGLTCIDACLTTNQRTFAMLGRDSDKMYIKLYDLEHSKKLSKVIVTDRKADHQVAETGSQENAPTRKKSLRSFVPVPETTESVNALEFDPSHLMNLVVTTSNRVAKVDIREDAIQHCYVDRSKLLSMLPVERFNQIAFSKTCDQQFYLLSNERVRVFDKRYLSQPMSSIGHMLDPQDHKHMNIKLFRYEQESIETLCLSSRNRLCFMSFDRGREHQSLIDNSGELINPTSLHAPVHKREDLKGGGKLLKDLHSLDVSNVKILPNEGIAFSVFQISQTGDICVRSFDRATDELQIVKPQSQAQVLLEQCKYQEAESDEDFSVHANDYQPSRNNKRKEISDDERIDLLDTSFMAGAEERLTSKRALEKYARMKERLYRRR